MARRILLADDEAFITTTIGARLRSLGHEVVCASDGDEAFGLIEEFVPHLVVSDYQMPVLDGYQLACRLKQNPATAQLPIVMLTARGHTLSGEQLALTNIRTLLAKPFSAKELVAVIDAILAEQDSCPEASVA
jgi:two-component system, OmpR family, phosphate regulon response regulator PhoB